ncbi:MAG TPA: hypothetical protein VFM28_11740 [Nitrososphaeraceae archaeon]|nr:hypothetical protein [Nitrososphaeraceae archaeon]
MVSRWGYGSRFDVLVVVSNLLFILKYLKIGDNLLVKAISHFREKCSKQ